MTNIVKYILTILISLICYSLYAFEGGVPFIQHSDSIFGAYSVAIKDLNTSGISIIGVAKMNGTNTSLLWSLSTTGEWNNTPCNFQFKIDGEENLPFLENDDIYTLLVDSSGTGEFDTSSTINYPCQYINSENIVFSNVKIPASQSHFTISKRELTDEEKENPYQYIHVHPSPSIDGNIFIECRLWEITPIEVEIYNVVGQPIFNDHFSNSNYYNVKATLPVSGTYVIIVKIQEQVLTYKVVRR